MKLEEDGDTLVRGEGVATAIDRKAGAAKTETDKSTLRRQRDIFSRAAIAAHSRLDLDLHLLT